MTMADLSAFHYLRTQHEVMKWTSTGKIDIDELATTTWMNRFLPPNDAKTFSFAIEELANPGKVVGTIGMHLFEPPECGYMFIPEVWGRAYATEALKAWLEKYWALPRVEVEVEGEEPEYAREEIDGVTREVMRALIEEHHIGSRRVLEKCGFKQYGRIQEEDTQRPGEGVMVWLDLYCFERPL
jgi:RimJ/RimL family protein N-acetyltransferase